MAAAGGRPHSSLIERLFNEPERFRFFQAVRLLERASTPAGARTDRTEQRRTIGEDADPAAEVVRFRALPSLSFPPAEIASLKESEEHGPEMTVTFMGLAGPTGVLPQHYTSTIIRTVRGRSSPSGNSLHASNNRPSSLSCPAWPRSGLPF